MRWIRALVFAALAAAAVYGLGLRHGQVPPLGAFLDPLAGFWQNGRGDDRVLPDRDIPGVQGSVRVLWDDRRVPHIFAENTHDVYFVQGYLTARDRLWQMDFLARVAGGRLAEILGPDLVEHDRFRRRTGMVRAAESAVAAMQVHAETQAALDAYVAGVNAWITSLDRASLPLEYKLLDHAPEPWTTLHVALIEKYMAWSLTGHSTDEGVSYARSLLGAGAIETLYPRVSPRLDPVIPADTAWDFPPVAVPPVPGASGAPAPRLPPPTMDPDLAPHPDNGSNNWAVSATRTHSGAAILANDPHLPLSLPSIWYELQLQAPGLDVYGVSLPGAPGVIIGFNRHIAWGVTNATSDVLDWYEVELRDGARDAYRYDGGWRETEKRTEIIRVRDGEDIVDEVVYTHHGPVVYGDGETPFQPGPPRGAAMRWSGHDPSNELATFLALGRARSYDEFVTALSAFDNPGQNFAFADITGDVALWHQGKFPLRWPGQGKVVGDGSDPAHEWQGWIPGAHNPHVKNPPRGFVSSANQPPTDPSYPYYLGWRYANFARGARINERLEALRDVTPQDMIDLQNDALDLRARVFLPQLLALLDPGALDGDLRQAHEELAGWDHESRADSVAATVFTRFLDALSEAVWSDDLPERDLQVERPDVVVTLELVLGTPPSPYVDDKRTEPVESPADVVRRAFRDAVAGLGEELGPLGPRWQLGQARGTDIRHLARIPGLGRDRLPTSGGVDIVNATSQHHGPSWRMVVEMGPTPDEIRGWGVYPGGQSGNPGSGHYDDFVDTWVRGGVYPLLFLPAPDAPEAEGERVLGQTRIGGDS